MTLFTLLTLFMLFKLFKLFILVVVVPSAPPPMQDFPNLRTVTAFEKLMLIQAVWVGRLMTGINGFCCDEMRVERLAPPR